MTHSCIKCSKPYQDTDPEPYLCTECNEKRKVIAKQVDSKFQGRVSRPVSQFREYEEMRKRTGMNFPSIKDLGISL